MSQLRIRLRWWAICGYGATIEQFARIIQRKSSQFHRNTVCSPLFLHGRRTMADALFRSESPTEFFRELVESAMQNQRVSAHELTSFYVVNLLAGFVHGDPHAGGDRPLGVRLVRALQTAGVAQRDGLRSVGDQSLFITGFFADSLNRSLVDVGYYMQLGELAYRSLARHGDATLGDVFDELSDKFDLRRCSRRGERAHVDLLERRRAPPLREMAAHGEPPER